jgi:hypothetical protein
MVQHRMIRINGTQVVIDAEEQGTKPAYGGKRVVVDFYLGVEHDKDVFFRNPGKGMDGQFMAVFTGFQKVIKIGQPGHEVSGGTKFSPAGEFHLLEEQVFQASQDFLVIELRHVGGQHSPGGLSPEEPVANSPAIGSRGVIGRVLGPLSIQDPDGMEVGPVMQGPAGEPVGYGIRFKIKMLTASRNEIIFGANGTAEETIIIEI